MSELWSLGRLLTWATDFLRRHGSESARLEAQLLLASVTSLDRVGLYVHFDRPASPAELQAFKALVQRRTRGEPVAYILGTREFFGRTFAVRTGVLVPRPETELLVEKVLAFARSGEAHTRIVDVGTGSGIIAITLALELPEAVVVAVDVSDDALAVASENAERHGVRDRVRLLRSDLLARGPTGQGVVDIVVSNPPYLPDDLMATLPRDVRDFEPHLALHGGPDGLAVIRRLLPEAARVLRPQGLLALEVAGTEQGRALLAELGEEPAPGGGSATTAPGPAPAGDFEGAQLHDDLARRGRVVTARRR